MIEANIGNKKLLMYDSIENMPIINFQAFNKYLLIDSGIGSDFADIDNHITKIAKFINTDKKVALQELQNMRQSLYFVSQGINPKHMSFVCFIYTIDGVQVTDFSDSSVQIILRSLGMTKKSSLDKLLDSLKKKLMKNLVPTLQSSSTM